MLQYFRENMQGLLAKIVIAIIIVPFALFGVESFISGAGANDVARVNDQSIELNELTRALSVRKNQLASQMGDNADPAMLTDEMLRGPVLESLINEEVLRQAVVDLGLAASSALVDGQIVKTPAFQQDGTFSPDLYRSLLAANGMTPLYYKNLVKEETINNQLLNGIQASAFSTQNELSAAVKVVAEKRTLRYITLPLASALQAVTLSDAESLAYYEENASQFKTEEQVLVDYILVDKKSFEPEITEQQLRDEYQREIELSERSTVREAAHIMINIDDDTSEAEALAKLQEVSQALAAGESFEALAKQYSQDSFSATEGGALGSTTGDVFPEPFEAALASLQVGEVSAPVVTEMGAHLIKLVSAHTEEPASFEERRPALLDALRLQAAEPLYVAKVQELEELSYNSVGLIDVADELKLPLVEGVALPRSGGDGVLSNAKVSAAAFSKEVLEAGHNSEVIEVSPEQTLVLRVAKHIPEAIQPYELVADQVAAQLRQQKAEQALSTQAADLIQQVKDGVEFSAIAQEIDAEWQVLQDVNRRAQADPEVMMAGFDVAADESVIYKDFSKRNGDRVVMQVSNVTEGKLQDLNTQELSSLKALLNNSAANTDLAAMRKALRSAADVTLL